MVRQVVVRLIALLLMMNQVTGCATLIVNQNRKVWVATVPPGAAIKLDGNDIGKSPVTLTVYDIYATNQITADLAGYDSAADVVKTSVEPWTFLNLLLGQFGLVGFIIDWASGSMFEVASNEMNLKLDKKSKDIDQQEI